MIPSQSAILQTRSAESCRLSAYLDTNNIPTYGWGSIYRPDGTRVQMGDTLTQEEADELYTGACNERAKQVYQATGDIPQNKFDACFCIVYNIGIGNFLKSTLYKKLKEDINDITIPNEFMEWIKSGGIVAGGLVIRRGREIAMWLECSITQVADKWVLLKEWITKENITN